MYFYKLIKYMSDKNIKIYRKLLFLLPVIYLLSPINIIPYMIFPVAGWIDNIIVAGALSLYLKKVLREYNPDDSSPEDDDNVIDLHSDDYDLK